MGLVFENYKNRDDGNLFAVRLQTFKKSGSLTKNNILFLKSLGYNVIKTTNIQRSNNGRYD